MLNSASWFARLDKTLSFFMDGATPSAERSISFWRISDIFSDPFPPFWGGPRRLLREAKEDSLCA